MNKGEPIEVTRLLNGAYLVSESGETDLVEHMAFETQKGFIKFLESHFRQSRKNGDGPVTFVETNIPDLPDSGEKPPRPNDSWSSEGSTLTSTPEEAYQPGDLKLPDGTYVPGTTGQLAAAGIRQQRVKDGCDPDTGIPNDAV